MLVVVIVMQCLFISCTSSFVTPITTDFICFQMRFRDDDMPFAHVVLAVEGCGWINPDYFPLMIGSAVRMPSTKRTIHVYLN